MLGPFGASVLYVIIKLTGFFLARLTLAQVFRPAPASTEVDIASPAVPVSTPAIAARFTIVRFALGIAGAGVMWVLTGAPGAEGIPLLVIAMLPVRVAVWAISVWLVFDPTSQAPSKILWCTFAGVIWSYMLDAPSLIAFFETAGRLVC